MNKYEEVILEIDGKIAYADSTGNMEAKEELLKIRKAIQELHLEEKRKVNEISGRNENEG